MNIRDPGVNQTIPDVQSSADTRRLAIDKVGIKSIRHPMKILERAGAVQHTVATFSMFVGLPHQFKGTHMSRFVEILNAHEREITVDSFRAMLRQMVKKLEAETGHIEMSFPYFVMKTAPVSGVASLMNYEASLIGEIHDGREEMWMRVVVPVTSLCPCSKRISERGAHNQRSHITIKAKVTEHLWLEELIDIAEQEASSELFGILKRVDEKGVTERAYDNPRFVEDLVRGVAARLSADPRIEAFAVDAENFESIHNHSAWARISRGL